MSEKQEKAVMPSNNMIEMFTYEIASKLSIEEIKEKVPAACEQKKFAVFQTYYFNHEYGNNA